MKTLLQNDLDVDAVTATSLSAYSNEAFISTAGEASLTDGDGLRTSLIASTSHWESSQICLYANTRKAISIFADGNLSGY